LYIVNFLKEIIVDSRIDDYFEKEDGTYYKNKKTGDYLIGCDEFLKSYRDYLDENNIEYKTNARDIKKYLNEINIERERKHIQGRRSYFFSIDKNNTTSQLESMNICNEEDEELGEDWE